MLVLLLALLAPTLAQEAPEVATEPVEESVDEPSPAITARLPKPFRFEALGALLDSLQLTPAPAE